MLRLDWLSQEVLGDVDKMTLTRPGDYLIKYLVFVFWMSRVMDGGRHICIQGKIPKPNVGVAALAG